MSSRSYFLKVYIGMFINQFLFLYLLCTRIYNIVRRKIDHRIDTNLTYTTFPQVTYSCIITRAQLRVYNFSFFLLYLYRQDQILLGKNLPQLLIYPFTAAKALYSYTCGMRNYVNFDIRLFRSFPTQITADQTSICNYTA